MNISLDGIVVVVGNYGSGKTEISINLAANRKHAGIDVSIADLDLVNPYFRTREARKQLSELGIGVILPPDRYLHADLPILTPAVAGLIRKPSTLAILDVGGDKVGANVLAALADALDGKAYRMLQVINPFRPFTDTLKGCMKIKGEIEKASGMSINGIIGNANLIDDTNAGMIYDGYDFVTMVSKDSGLPLEFITVPAWLYDEIDMNRFLCPLLVLQRQLVPPWKKAAVL
ncbi:MAG: cobalamin biosynthesis protein CbiA [Proteobacteria bacterium]|nr:cobalamin biosynthesis protein CbiA [Pseudomonadota bacterium]